MSPYRFGFATQLFIVLLVLLPVALVPVTGWWLLFVSGLLGLLLLQQLPPGWRTRLIMLLALIGGVIGVANAAWALLAVAAEPAYRARAGFGWAALLLAVLASLGGLVAVRRPGSGGLIMLLAGLAGVVVMSLFYINTFYAAAAIFWLAGSLLAFLATANRSSKADAPSREQ